MKVHTSVVTTNTPQISEGLKRVSTSHKAELPKLSQAATMSKDLFDKAMIAKLGHSVNLKKTFQLPIRKKMFV
jgi:hypothetical protein